MLAQEASVHLDLTHHSLKRDELVPCRSPHMLIKHEPAEEGGLKRRR